MFTLGATLSYTTSGSHRYIKPGILPLLTSQGGSLCAIPEITASDEAQNPSTIYEAEQVRHVQRLGLPANSAARTALVTYLSGPYFRPDSTVSLPLFIFSSRYSGRAISSLSKGEKIEIPGGWLATCARGGSGGRRRRGGGGSSAGNREV